MSADGFYPFVDSTRHLAAGVAITTNVCREAQRLHRCAPTSCIALGRVLTACGMAARIQERGPVSFQMIGNGHLGQVYADVTPEGNLRGYVTNPTLAMSRPQGTVLSGRRSIAAAVGKGHLSAIRLGSGREFQQSTVDLVSGELDLDVEAYLNNSDQVPTALVCDVLMEGNNIVRAAGLIVQAMPDGDAEAVQGLRQTLHERFAELLGDTTLGPAELIAAFVPKANPAGAPVALQWKCRCSYERAVAGLKMLGPEELAKMVDDKEEANISCDFCETTYVVPASEVEQAFLDTITARG